MERSVSTGELVILLAGNAGRCESETQHHEVLYHFMWEVKWPLYHSLYCVGFRLHKKSLIKA